MSTGKHVHKLRRHRYTNGEEIYFCILPECRFKINTKLALGKRAICNRCDNEFIMNELSIRLAKPHCVDCTKGKDEAVQDQIQDVLLSAAKDTIKENLRKRFEKVTRRSPRDIEDVISSKSDLL